MKKTSKNKQLGRLCGAAMIQDSPVVMRYFNEIFRRFSRKQRKHQKRGRHDIHINVFIVDKADLSVNSPGNHIARTLYNLKYYGRHE